VQELKTFGHFNADAISFQPSQVLVVIFQKCGQVPITAILLDYIPDIGAWICRDTVKGDDIVVVMDAFQDLQLQLKRLQT
jgi:hypothetical protein